MVRCRWTERGSTGIGKGFFFRWRTGKPFGAIWAASGIAVFTHVALDVLSGASVRVAWPISSYRTSIGLVAMADPWLIALVGAALGLLLTHGMEVRQQPADPRMSVRAGLQGCLVGVEGADVRGRTLEPPGRHRRHDQRVVGRVRSFHGMPRRPQQPAGLERSGTPGLGHEAGHRWPHRHSDPHVCVGRGDIGQSGPIGQQRIDAHPQRVFRIGGRRLLVVRDVGDGEGGAEGLAGLIDRREDNGQCKADERYIETVRRVLQKRPRDFGHRRPTWSKGLLIRTAARQTGVVVSKTTMGRVLKTLIPEDKVVHVDALPLYKKYTDIFSMDDVPEDERKAVARQVADRIIASLKECHEPAMMQHARVLQRGRST